MQDVETEIRITKNEETYSPAIAGAVAAAEAWLKAACGMAIKYPRDIEKVRLAMLRECDRPSFAAVALYSKPVGGSKVTGLSIRFAEAAIQALGHIHVTTQTLAENDEYRKVEVRVWDAQSMTSIADEATIQKTIERKQIPKERMRDVLRQRSNASGEILYILRAEEGDMLNTVNAAKSKAMRNCGLRLVPGWLLDECKTAINETMRKKDASDPDKSKRELYDAFSELGVTIDSLQEYIGHKNPTLQPAELQELRKLYTAIKTGETTIQAVLAVKKEKEDNGKKGTEALKDRLKGQDAPCITSEQAKELEVTAEKAGFKPLEWKTAISQKFQVGGTERIPAPLFESAQKLARGE